MSRTIRIALGIASLLAAAACQHAAPAPQRLDGPICVPPPGMGALCVYRNQTQGASPAVDVAIDGQHLGQLTNDQFVQVDVRPGGHNLAVTVLSGKPPNVVLTGKPSSVDLTVAEGAATFARVTTEDGAPGVVIPTARATDVAQAEQEIREDCQRGPHTSVGGAASSPAAPASSTPANSSM